MAKQSDKEIKQIVDDIFDDFQQPVRKMMERIWFRNILYYIGEQYIEWIVSLHTFRRKPTHPFLPTPVSNIIRDHVKAMNAMILNKEYAVRIWPNSNEQEDREAALAGEDLLVSMDQANDDEFAEEKEKVILWMNLCGTSFMRTFPMLDRGEMAIDKSGNIIKSGDVVAENVMCFNVYLDNVADSLRKSRYAGIKSLKHKEWVEDTFNVKLKAAEGEQEVQYQRRLTQLMANVSPWKGKGLESQLMNLKMQDLVIFKEVEFKPTVKYPNGRYVIRCGDDILVDNDQLPIPTKKESWLYTLTDFHYNRVPGRFWSDACVNDLISPQNSINSIDQALELNRKGLGRPMVLTPSDVNLKRKTGWGSSLLAVEYDALLSGGQKPEVHNGIPLPEQVIKERDIHKTTAQDSGGDPKHVLRGKAPTSQASGIMVDILKEAAESSHQPDIMRTYRSLKRVYRKRLILAKNLFTEKRMLKISGEGNEIKIREFKASDLRDNTDVRLELASGISSTKAGETNIIMELVEKGAFGDLSADPETRQELFRRLGLSGFRDKISVDVRRAEQENIRIKNGRVDGIYIKTKDPKTGEEIVLMEDPLFKYDNHFIHYEVIRRFILSQEFTALPEPAREIALAHAACHVYEIQLQMKTQAMGAGPGMVQGMAGEQNVGENKRTIPEGGTVTA